MSIETHGMMTISPDNLGLVNSGATSQLRMYYTGTPPKGIASFTSGIGGVYGNAIRVSLVGLLSGSIVPGVTFPIGTDSVTVSFAGKCEGLSFFNAAVSAAVAAAGNPATWNGSGLGTLEQGLVSE